MGGRPGDVLLACGARCFAVGWSPIDVAMEFQRQVAVVVIGRNEGARLEAALGSALRTGVAVTVYADSGSSDDSVASARNLLGERLVHELDPARPFTASRGRNEGFAVARRADANFRYVQFLDGDCTLHPEWLRVGADYLDRHPEVVAVAGRLREERRDRNPYHRLADMEWDRAPGEVETTGGIWMVRADAFARSGGYDERIAAGEELEFSLRLCAQGEKIVRLADDMAYHDIDMARFGQWWRRAVRSGEAYAEGYYVQRLRGKRPHLKEVMSVLAWGAAVPSVCIAASTRLPLLGGGLLAAAYGRLWWKVYHDASRRQWSPDDARLYATAVVLQKFAGVVGVARFLHRWSKRDVVGKSVTRSRLFETNASGSGQ